MDWDAIGAVGQVLGSFAVFITLGYLSVQVRHARSDSKRALSQGRDEAIRELNRTLLDERMASILAKAESALDTPIPPVVQRMMNEAKLTREETISLLAHIRTTLAYYTQLIPYVDELHPIQRKAFDEGIRFQYGPGGGPYRIFYEAFVRNLAHPDTVRYIEGLLAQPSSTP
jgi:hypothetical protein